MSDMHSMGGAGADVAAPRGTPVAFKSRNPFNKTVLCTSSPPEPDDSDAADSYSGNNNSGEAGSLLASGSGAPPSPPMHEDNNPELIADAISRLNRFAAELSNERTLLAWIRTAMAAARTLFAYYALFAIAGTHSGWNFIVLALQVLVAIFMFGLCITGIARFLRVKQILRMSAPPLKYRRLSVTPLLWLITIIAAVTTIGTYAQQWTRVKPS